jgi:glycosyltransferase involved in cell wall biosynthesis
MRVLFISSGLGIGGAEVTLHRLLGATRCDITPAVVSLTDLGPIGERIQGLGVPVTALGLNHVGRAWRAPGALGDLVLRLRPDLIQGWMYHGNLAACWARRRWAPSVPLAWGIRQSLAGRRQEKVLTRWVIRVGAWRSSRADALVYNAWRSAEEHEAVGYDGRRRVVIPNGIDTAGFRPDPDARRLVRLELGIDPATLVLAQVARHHPMKGHDLLLEALSMLHRQGIEVHSLLIGRGLDRDNRALVDRCEALGLADRVHLLGERQDLARLWQAVDIGVSPSLWGEGFPTAMGEAMACAVPCVVTDVGDSARLLDRPELVVPPGDPWALADSLAALALAGREQRLLLGERLRCRVEGCFGVPAMAQGFVSLYRNLVAGQAPGAS